MATNHVFVDYENVKAGNLDLLADGRFKVMIFLGANHAKIPTDLVLKVQKLHAAEYIQISGNGPNALDFHIAFYIGRLSTEEPDCYFHIVSKDKGFDPLVKHLKSKKIRASRVDDVSEILLRKPVPTRDEDTIIEILKNLSRRGASRPRKLRTLAGTIRSLFKGTLDEKKVQFLIGGLQEQGHIVVDGEKVSYKLGEWRPHSLPENGCNAPPMGPQAAIPSGGTRWAHGRPQGIGFIPAFPPVRRDSLFGIPPTRPWPRCAQPERGNRPGSFPRTNAQLYDYERLGGELRFRAPVLGRPPDIPVLHERRLPPMTIRMRYIPARHGAGRACRGRLRRRRRRQGQAGGGGRQPEVLRPGRGG